MSLLQDWSSFRRRHKRLEKWVGAVAIAVICALLAVAATDNIAFLTAGERFVQDLQIAEYSPPAPQDSNILVLAITEDTMRQFPYRSPLDRGFLAKLLTALDDVHPRAIGLDYLLDQPTEPAKDAALRQVLQNMKTPMAVSYLENNIVDPQQIAFLNGFVPSKMRVFANVGTDQTDTVRWVYPGGMDYQHHYLPSFPRALAAKVGVNTSAVQVPMAWHGNQGKDTDAFSKMPGDVWLGLPAALRSTLAHGRVVLIGSDLTLVDHHRTPFATNPLSDQGSMAGVVIFAHALSQFMNHRAAPEPGSARILFVTFLLALIGGGLALLPWSLWWRVGLLAGLLVALWALGIFFLFGDLNFMVPLIAPTLAAAASFAAVDSLEGLEARRQRAFIHGAFARYVSPKLVERMVEDPSRMALEGERKLMTYLFSDIQNFTTMSEKLESQELTRLLNAYLNGMTDIVLRHDGMVDKFIGDSVMAVFNAPIDLPDHAAKAVRCMLAMDDFCEAFRREQKALGIPLGETRIGVHTGIAVIGNFGSQARFTYTAQGDAVNAASRLEGINKYLGTRLCVSNATRLLCPDIAFRPVASVILKGKTEALELWEPLHDGVHSPEFLGQYQMAYARLKEGQEDAAALFAALLMSHPDDPCVKLHIERLRAGADGVEMVMTEK